MKKIIICLGIGLSILSAGETTGKELFEKNCMTCHATSKSFDQVKAAPPIMGVAKRVKMYYSNKEDAVNFIVDFAQNPNASVSVFPDRAVQKFGLMPSMKGIMTDEEFKKVGEYIYDNFPFGGKRRFGGQGKFGGM